MNRFFTMEAANGSTRHTDIIKDILRKELQAGKIEFDFDRIGAPPVLEGAGEWQLKNIVYYVKQGTCWKPVEFRSILQAFNEVLNELNRELEKEGKNILSLKPSAIQSRISWELTMNAKPIDHPIVMGPS